MALYSKVEYWNERYGSPASSEPYEWYQSYKQLLHLFDPTNLAAPATESNGCHRPFVSREDCRILILGCGNSKLGEEMLLDGWTGGIVNIDFSPVVIKQMKNKYGNEFYQKVNTSLSSSSLKPMEFICSDITERLPFDDKSFDLIICKGSFDAVLCSSGSAANIRKLVQESVRLLKDGSGVFFLVTYGNPDNRVVYLEHDNELDYYWSNVSVHQIPGQKHANKNDYVYICRKCNALNNSEKSSKMHPSLSNTENISSNKPRLGENANNTAACTTSCKV